MVQLAFNAAEHDPNANNFEALPAGVYPVVVEESEMRPTKNRTGHYLELKLAILDGDHKGRVVYDRLNLDNKNQKAVEIARSQFSQLCHAVNVLQISDSQQLHNKPLAAKLKVSPANGKYEASNDVVRYSSISTLSDDDQPQAAQPQAIPAGHTTTPLPDVNAAAPVSAAPVTGDVAPWDRAQ